MLLQLVVPTITRTSIGRFKVVRFVWGWTSKPDVIFHCFGRRNALSNGRPNWYSIWRPKTNVKWMMKMMMMMKQRK
jgi:hypothetical protein